MRAAVGIPLIANGEVWTVDDFRRCQQESGCADIMLGRGALADPLLARRVRGEPAGGWEDIRPALASYWHRRPRQGAAGTCRRADQAMAGAAAPHYPEAEALYQRLRPVKAAADIDRLLVAAGILGTVPLAA